MNRILSTIIAIPLILMGSFTNIFAAEVDTFANIPDELIARKLKKHDASLAISAEAVLHKLKQNQEFTLVDVRGRQDFEPIGQRVRRSDARV